MKLDKQKIVSPNSEYETKTELSRLFFENNRLTNNEIDILKSCKTEDHESIGLLGCLINDESDINKARLLIGSLNTSNLSLAKKSTKLLNHYNSDVQRLIDHLALKFTSEELSEYENSIYSILFEVLPKNP